MPSAQSTAGGLFAPACSNLIEDAVWGTQRMAQDTNAEPFTQSERSAPPARVHDNLRIFSGNANRPLALKIAAHLGLPLGKLQLSCFADGEIRAKVDESARGMDVFIVQPTCAPVNDSLMELLILVDAFRRASAARITLVIPYYGYSRQDKKVKPREPVTARLVADLITTAGAHRVLAVDLHAGQIQGFFQLPMDHLYAGPLLGAYFAEQGLSDHDTVVVSPDVGGVSRARGMAEMLHAPLAIIAKRRPEPNQVEIKEIIGDIAGKTCVMVDDMIDTGGSIVSGAAALMARGARRVFACCTHPVLSLSALEKIDASPLTELVVTDTIPLREEMTRASSKVRVISVAPLLANAISRIHQNQSVSELFDTYW